MLTRDEIIPLLYRYNPDNDTLVRHMIAVETIMAGLAAKFGEPAERWALAGLVHDIDYTLTLDCPEEHGLKAEQILTGHSIAEPEILAAVKAHSRHSLVPRDSLLAKSLFCCDPVTGFVTACSLMHPSKAIGGLPIDFMMKRFKEKRFARGADRDQIRACADIGMELEEFLMFSADHLSNFAGFQNA